MIRVFMICSLLWAVIASTSEACSRCGLFGRLCRYQNVVPVKHYVVPAAAVVKQADVFVVQNNYPQPIGAYAAQGASVYGYQAAAQAYYVNPAEVIRQAAELSKAATATATIGLTGFNQTAQTQLALQASISEPLARGHAAAQVLGAAGLSQPYAQQQSLALRIYQENGSWKVEQSDGSAITARVQSEMGAVPPIPQAPSASQSVIKEKCVRCHGLTLTEPKGGIFLDAGHKLDCKVVLKALQMVKDNKMPKDSPALTPQEKGIIMEELLALAKED